MEKKDMMLGNNIERTRFARMLVGLFVVLGVVSVTAPEVWSGQTIFNLNKGFSFEDKDVRLPFGQPIILRGVHDQTVTKLTVTAAFGLREQVVNAFLGDTTWSAQVGPFPVGRTVTFRFDAEKRLSEEELTSIAEDLRESLWQLRNYLDTVPVNITTDDHYRLLRGFLSENVPSEFKNYTDESGVTLHALVPLDLVPEDTNDIAVLPIIMTRLLGTRSKLEVVRKQAAEVDSVFNNTTPPLDSAFMAAIATELAQLKKITDDSARFVNDPSFRDAGITALETLSTKAASKLRGSDKILVDSASGDARVAEDSTKSWEAQNESIIQGMLDRFKLLQRAAVYLSSQATSQDVSPLENYAGFDVGAQWIPGADAVGSFFTVNVHLKKIALDENVKFELANAFSVSVGIALESGGVDADSEVYFMGGGIRLNKHFRVTTGTTFYKRKGTEDFIYYWSGGLSINFRQVGDLIRIFTGAKSEFED